MSNIEDRAEQVRAESLERALANPKIRDSTRATMAKIDEACRRIVGRRGELSIVGTVRMLEELYPGARLAEQTFYNKTSSGACYREVIAIWRTYEQALGQAKKARKALPVPEDLPDILLNQLQPEGARVVVLAMRTSLRNLRRQMQILRELSPDKLVRHRASSTRDAAQATTAPALEDEERQILEAFVDAAETASRGSEWDDLGRLRSDSGEILSRPGLLPVLRKVLEASHPDQPAPVKGKGFGDAVTKR